MIILSITSVILGIAVAYYVAEAAIMRQTIREQDRTIDRLHNTIDDQQKKLREIRSEYDRAVGATSYRLRPVNRISRMYPR